MKEKLKDVQEVYEKDWKKYIEIDGVIDIEKVKQELHDYSFVMEQYSKILCHIVNLSKVGYFANDIIQRHDECWLRKEFIKDDLIEMIDSYKEDKDFDSLAAEIKEYFELDEDIKVL